MESVSGEMEVGPPWHLRDFFSEDGLRAAQEYYFQTHATQSRLIAEGRNAQGVAKSFVRRKLTKEIGEDFKMYTGTAIGGAAGENEEPKGIRGELNEILGHIYKKIAPTTPITSPIQEDLTILKHPHGGLEACYAMVFYYNSLLRRYASLASNRRVMLRSIMDEELFKWIWRTVIGYMMASAKVKSSLEDSHLSAGINHIPLERQRVPYGQKINEIGMFLLSNTMKESKLRAPLCHFYVIYLRQLQAHLLVHLSRKEVDEVYKKLTRRSLDDPIDHPLVAVDVLMNNKGNSMDSFDDVLRDDSQVSRMIPSEEAEFINQFEDFGNPKRLANTLRKMVPDPRKEPEESQASSLMPLTLMLRTMPGAIREMVLAKMPVPMLNMVRNRIANTAIDDVGKDLLFRIKGFLDARRESGETYTISAHIKPGKAAVAASVRTQPVSRQGEGAPASQTPGESAPPGSSSGEGAEPAPTIKELAAEAGGGEENVIDRRSLLSWKVSGGAVTGVSLSPRDLMSLAGKELRVLLPWVVFSLRTGQVFGIEPDKISRELVEKLLRSLHDNPEGIATGSLSKDVIAGVVQQAKGAPMSKVLLDLAGAGGIENFSVPPPDLAPCLESLGEKFGEKLEPFLQNPGDESFRELRAGLSGEEKRALSLLHRVARVQPPN